MAGIDDHVVSMKFDNETFQRKLSDTLKSLDKLKQSLDFANSSQGLNELNNASKRFSLGNMGAAVEGMSAKFLAMSTIAITALSNITSHAISAGGRIVKSLSLDPVLDGFREYEINMNSIQTILANTKADGSTLDDVNEALDQLNTYSDQTIYNFAEMARNIGTFTAAGVGLDQSVNAIKGIANLAAISGSNSGQASTAMYQLSQALAAGKVNLMDWNSVVNAGMGGEVFKKALFETGKAMKTITDVPLGASFEEWEKKGGTFREQMEKGWLTADVLSTTLEAFSGDLDESALKAAGFSEAAAKEMVELGKLGIAAATEVKTFSQLMGTMKESVASGWSATFRLLLGDFEEAKKLFTDINNAVGKMIGDSADRRNEMLEGWRELGGRDLVIKGFTNAFKALGAIIKPIKEAFRDIFPPMTAERLMSMTKSFAAFTEKLKIGEGTATKIKSVFSGLFSVLSIGWEVFKGIAGVIVDFVSSLSGVGGGILGFSASIGDVLTRLHEVLVAGGGIRDFFDNIGEAIKKPGTALDKFRETIAALFGGFAGGEALEGVLDRIGDRFDGLAKVGKRLGSIWDKFSDAMGKVRDVLAKVWDYISNWFSELGSKIAAVMNPSDFNGAIDALNVGLLGGLIIMLKKFISDGLSLDFGNGFMDKITGALDGVTGALENMQANVKANTLLKIAGAMALLTVSIVALSLIDSASLAKAMVAIGVGFGQLVGVLTLLSTLNLSTGAKLVPLAVSLILLSGAMILLSIAIKRLSDLGWTELAKGLIGVGVGLAMLTASTQLIATNTSGMIRAGIAMGLMSGALLLLSYAVKSFSDLSWGELAKGLVGVGVGLGLLTTAMNHMPKGMVAQGAGLILVAAGLLVLAEAVKAFADISWGDMAKGMVGVAASLVVIAGAMRLMPTNMLSTAAGLVLVGGALILISRAISSMGAIPFGEMAKGIGGIAATMLILAVALRAMNGTAAGAGAMLVASASMLVLAGALKVLGSLSIAQIVTGLLTLTVALAIMGGAAIILAPLAPVLLTLGASMILVGAAFALFGVAAILVVKAIETLVKIGAAGVDAFMEAFRRLATFMPEVITAVVASIVNFVSELLAAVPTLLKGVTAILGHILDSVIELAPKLAEAFGAVITAVLTLIREKVPEFVETGFALIVALLTGIRDNLPQIVTLALEVITGFLSALATGLPTVINAGVDLVVAYLNGIASRMGDIIAAGVNLLVSFLTGIAANIARVSEAAITIITTFIKTVGGNAGRIISAGFKMLTDLLSGIGNNLTNVTNTVGRIIATFLQAMGNNATRIVNAGADALVRFLNGVANNIGRVVRAGVDVIIAFVNAISSNMGRVASAGADAVIRFVNSLAGTIRSRSGELRSAGVNLASAIIDGMTGGLASGVGRVASQAANMAKNALGAAKRALGINSPSKAFMVIGQQMAEGIVVALDKDQGAARSAGSFADRIVSKLSNALSYIPDDLSGMEEFSPTITPVLDMSKVQASARNIGGIFGGSSIAPEVSLRRANAISSIQSRVNDPDEPAVVQAAPTEIRFEQNVYSPEALNANEIYRQTRSQIALAKEELGI